MLFQHACVGSVFCTSFVGYFFHAKGKFLTRQPLNKRRRKIFLFWGIYLLFECKVGRLMLFVLISTRVE